ncbi:hypothetical protein ACHAXS_010444 [Conticribra weissflogii]
MMKRSILIPIFLSTQPSLSFAFGTVKPNVPISNPAAHTLAEQPRRQILQKSGIVILSIAGLTFDPVFSTPPLANAASDQKPKEFNEVGQQEPPPEGERPFVTLSNGVQVKDFRVGGSGGAVVQQGSKVELTLKGRLLNLNGVIFYDTKSNDPNGFGEGTPLLFTVVSFFNLFFKTAIDVFSSGFGKTEILFIPFENNACRIQGDGSVLPGLESGVAGMTKGGIRRIIVPADVGYGKYPDLEPRPFNEMEKRALDSVVKNPRRDGTVLFDVKVERVR